jgi:hypothetical protein
MTTDSHAQAEERLERTLGGLNDTLVKVQERYDHLLHPAKSLLFTFLKGIMYGLGFLVGFAVIIPILLALMRTIDWIPIVGNLVHRIEVQVQEVQQNGRR